MVEKLSIEFQTPVLTSIKNLFLLWTAAVFVSFILLDDGNYIGFFISMIVHELGHTAFSFIAGIPAISFFFASFPFSSEPVLTCVVLLGAGESFAGWYCYRKGLILLPCLAVLAFMSHIFFLLIPRLAQPFLIFGGVGGEFVLPLLLLIFMTTFKHLRSKRGMIVFGLASIAFWRAIINWGLVLSGCRSIPYPRDGGDSFVLFQDPFAVADGAPVGDMERLIKIYGWSEPTLMQAYVGLGGICLVCFCMIWFWSYYCGVWNKNT